MAVMIDKETKEAVPVTAFLDAGQVAKDLRKVNDAARGRKMSVLGMALALMKNYDPFKAPTHFKLSDLMKKFDKTFGATGRDYGKVTGDRTKADIDRRRSDRWNFLFIAGMWFQDLFNYDFRRTERCIIPYATQEGEISFCAYNTGIGWRNIIEKMHMTATLTKWYEQHGRHEIFAGNKAVPLASTEHHLVLDAAAVAAGKQTDLDEAGIAKNAREEKLIARAAKNGGSQALENERMMQLYRKHVLKDRGCRRAGRADPGAPQEQGKDPVVTHYRISSGIQKSRIRWSRAGRARHSSSLHPFSMDAGVFALVRPRVRRSRALHGRRARSALLLVALTAALLRLRSPRPLAGGRPLARQRRLAPHRSSRSPQCCCSGHVDRGRRSPRAPSSSTSRYVRLCSRPPRASHSATRGSARRRLAAAALRGRPAAVAHDGRHLPVRRIRGSCGVDRGNRGARQSHS